MSIDVITLLWHKARLFNGTVIKMAIDFIIIPTQHR